MSTLVDPSRKSPVTGPLISVIFCINRGNPYLRAAVQSVLNQTYANFEFLIGANACSDDFFHQLKELATDDRIRLFRTQLPQLAFTLNFLIENSAADLLVRMDADDISEPQRFERLVAAISVSDADVIGSWATLIDENDRVIGSFEPPLNPRELKGQMILSSPIIHPTVIFKKRFWMESRGYLGGFVSEDFDLWLRGLARGAKILNIPEFLLRYRIHSAQVSRSRLGYAETAAHWYRELLHRPSFYNFRGWLVATTKALVVIVRDFGRSPS